MANPCAYFKPLKDEKAKARRKPPTYSQEEIDRLFAACDDFEKAILATLLLTGLRKQELYYYYCVKYPLYFSGPYVEM